MRRDVVLAWLLVILGSLGLLARFALFAAALLILLKISGVNLL